jgi:hypothetical protein
MKGMEIPDEKIAMITDSPLMRLSGYNASVCSHYLKGIIVEA